MKFLRPALLALCAASLAAPAARADEPRIEIEDAPWGYRYEYEDNRCSFAYELEYEAGFPEIEEEGHCPPAYALPRFEPPVPIGTSGVRGPRHGGGGFCEGALAGALAGAVVGGAIGSRIGSGDDPTVAIVLGGLVGGVLGHEVGRRISEADRRCMGLALEHAEPGIGLDWTNPESGLHYDLRDFGPYEDRHGVRCRSFEMRVEGGQWREAEACQRGDGGWQLVELR